jgi:hypothetical protein
MSLLLRHGSVRCLLGIACLIVCTEVRARGEDAAQKRAFAARLARRAEVKREGVAKVSAAAKHHSGAVSPSAANLSGIPSASPISPSGFGLGRDGFIIQFYPLALGRNAYPSEVDYWASRLAAGVSPETVAAAIFGSQERRSLIQSGLGTGIPFQEAYSISIRNGNIYRRSGGTFF